MRRLLIAVSALSLVSACSSYEARIDVAVAPAEAVATVSSGIYGADDPQVASLPRLPYRQAFVDARFDYPPGTRGTHTWHVKLSFTKDEKLRWHGTQEDGAVPSSVLVLVVASGRRPVERRFACGPDGLHLDLVGVLERAR